MASASSELILFRDTQEIVTSFLTVADGACLLAASKRVRSEYAPLIEQESWRQYQTAASDNAGALRKFEAHLLPDDQSDRLRDLQLFKQLFGIGLLYNTISALQCPQLSHATVTSMLQSAAEAGTHYLLNERAPAAHYHPLTVVRHSVIDETNRERIAQELIKSFSRETTRLFRYLSLILPRNHPILSRGCTPSTMNTIIKEARYLFDRSVRFHSFANRGVGSLPDLSRYFPRLTHLELDGSPITTLPAFVYLAKSNLQVISVANCPYLNHIDLHFIHTRSWVGTPYQQAQPLLIQTLGWPLACLGEWISKLMSYCLGENDEARRPYSYMYLEGLETLKPHQIERLPLSYRYMIKYSVPTLLSHLMKKMNCWALIAALPLVLLIVLVADPLLFLCYNMWVAMIASGVGFLERRAYFSTLP